MMTGMEAITVTRIATHNLLSLKTMKNAAENTTIIAAIDTKSVASPISNFLGNRRRKSFSVYREVRMDKKFTIDAEDDTSDIASDMAKILKETFSRKKGNPVSPLLPPGTVKAAAKTTVAISVATSMQDVAVSFIHFSPCSLRFSCFLVNNALGVRPSSFLASADRR